MAMPRWRRRLSMPRCRAVREAPLMASTPPKQRPGAQLSGKTTTPMAAGTISAGQYFLNAAGVQVQGQGRPLLLINGLLHGCELWELMLRHLPAGRQIIRFDFPHQNDSEFCAGYQSFERYCDFVMELLAELRLEPSETEAIGFSIGGDVLRTLIVERGVRFRHVIIAASAPPGIERFWKEFFVSALECLRRGHLDTFVRLIAFQFYSPLYIERFPKLIHVMHLKYLQKFPNARRLEELLSIPLQRRRPDPVCDAVLRGRATLIHALYDQLVPIGPARRYADELGLPVHDIECGHSLLAEAPDAFAQHAMRILGSRDARAAGQNEMGAPESA
jgi:pimeloyl-ACP methyl ester carboxylesterase